MSTYHPTNRTTHDDTLGLPYITSKYPAVESAFYPTNLATIFWSNQHALCAANNLSLVATL